MTTKHKVARRKLSLLELASESSTTGKAGGLKESEPLKAVENLGPPKGGYSNKFS